MQATQERWVQSLSQEDPLEREMATHSSILAWTVPWTEWPGGLQSMGSQRVGHDSDSTTATPYCDHRFLCSFSKYFSFFNLLLSFPEVGSQVVEVDLFVYFFLARFSGPEEFQV